MPQEFLSTVNMYLLTINLHFQNYVRKTNDLFNTYFRNEQRQQLHSKKPENLPAIIGTHLLQNHLVYKVSSLQ